MTLILTCLTNQVVVQASDQRLIDPTTYEVRDEYANKATVYDSAMALAYTGVSRVPGTQDTRPDTRPGAGGWMTTDEWVSGVLAAHRLSLPDGLRAVTEGLSHLVGTKYKLAVVGGGWGMKSSTEPIPVPLYFRTANFIDAKGDICPCHAPFTERFESHRYPSSDRSFLLREAGQRLTLPERAQLTTAIRRCLTKRLGPAQIERELVKAVRTVADRLEAAGTPTVGRSVVSASLPRAAFASRDPTFGAKEANLAQASFRYYPDDADEPRQHMPNLVIPQFNLSFSGMSFDLSELGGSGDIFGLSG